MSMYDPIWDAIKSSPNHTKSVVVNRNLHARIIKAVKKRKWLDIPFKVSIEPKTSWLSISRSGNTLTFHLSIYYPKDMKLPSNVTVDAKGKIVL
jgi:hypothetical protein